MAVLEKKIDFALIFSVKNANPNGDPLSGNMPRVTIDGAGELSDVCLKRKIRDRLQEAGEKIFVQSDDNRVDNYKTLKERAEKELTKEVMGDAKNLAEKACKTWIDVRAFGQLFAYKGEGKGSGVSVGIRGPVTIQSAFSHDPVNVSSIQITKSVSGEGDGTKKASDTMGMKHRVDFGLYVTFGSINPQLATKTSFSYEDAKKLAEKACKTWIDVRAFGQLFAYKGEGKGSGVSVGIRGPVTIQSAFSHDPVNITSIQITKSVSGEGDGTKKASDTMGMKHRVDFGLYTTYGSINPQLAMKTGFSYEDAQKIKLALLHIFDNDASSARPEGSMEVIQLYWWEHSSKSGQYSSAKVHRSLKIAVKNISERPQAVSDYDIAVESLDGLKPEVLTY
jgi:CRISPR-associated protein Csd2